MKTPQFWHNKNLISNILLPLGSVYGALTAFRLLTNKPKEVTNKVICIGNITAGGTGKTPVAISIANLLKEKNKKPYFISRGYGGTKKDIFVNPKKHSPDEVGDEPMLLSKVAPTVINPNRFDAATKAINDGAEYIIMDDGFQNPGLKKDLSLIVVDGKYGFGNERCIPAGPLREFLSNGIKRASAIIILGEDKHNIALKYKLLPIFRAKVVPLKPDMDNKNIIAFAGIGHPAKFFDSLTSLGFNIIEKIEFPDHYKYDENELMELIQKAKKKKAAIYTTSKDHVKIPAFLKSEFKVLEIEIQWEDKDKILDFII